MEQKYNRKTEEGSTKVGVTNKLNKNYIYVMDQYIVHKRKKIDIEDNVWK